MKTRILVAVAAAMAVLIVGRSAGGTGETGVRLDRDVTLRVEKGDTLQGLFGPDLMRVVERNWDLIPSPHWLGEGLEIVVPAYTYLSPRAVEHLNRARRLRQEAEAAVRKAQAAQRAFLKGGEGALAGPAYGEARQVLARALQALGESPPNYLAARQLGEEATRLLAVSSGQARLARQIKKQQRIATFFLVLALGMGLPAWIVLKHRHNARLQKEIRQRLQQHFQRLQEL